MIAVCCKLLGFRYANGSALQFKGSYRHDAISLPRFTISFISANTTLCLFSTCSGHWVYTPNAKFFYPPLDYAMFVLWVVHWTMSDAPICSLIRKIHRASWCLLVTRTAGNLHSLSFTNCRLFDLHGCLTSRLWRTLLNRSFHYGRILFSNTH